MASRRETALPLIAAFTLLALCACDDVVTITSTLNDDDASIDVAIDEETEPAVDAVDEEPEPEYEFNTCLGACALQAWCFGGPGWPDPLPDELCGAMCARFTSESRRCLNDAAETFDCLAFLDCQGEIDDQCYTICEFVLGRCNPSTLCYYYCPMYTAPPRDCAFSAAASLDCGRTAECLMGHYYRTTCHDACTMLIETCGVDADFDSCMGLCDYLDIDSMSRSCIDAAAYWDDCQALAACGGLVP